MPVTCAAPETISWKCCEAAQLRLFMITTTIGKRCRAMVSSSAMVKPNAPSPTRHRTRRPGSAALRAERQAHAEADGSQKSVSDVAARAVLPDHFVEPVIGLRSVGDDGRVGVDAVHEGGHRLVRMDGGRRACGLAHLGLQSSALEGADAARSRRCDPAIAGCDAQQGAKHLAAVGDHSQGDVAQAADLLGIDLHMDDLRGARNEPVGRAEREQAEAHTQREHDIGTLGTGQVGHLVEGAAVQRVVARQQAVRLEVREHRDSGALDELAQLALTGRTAMRRHRP